MWTQFSEGEKRRRLFLLFWGRTKVNWAYGRFFNLLTPSEPYGILQSKRKEVTFTIITPILHHIGWGFWESQQWHLSENHFHVFLKNNSVVTCECTVVKLANHEQRQVPQQTKATTADRRRQRCLKLEGINTHTQPGQRQTANFSDHFPYTVPKGQHINNQIPCHVTRKPERKEQSIFVETYVEQQTLTVNFC